MLHEAYVLRFGMSKVIIAGEAQDDPETFVFTVEPCSFPQSRLGNRCTIGIVFGVRKGNYG
jgi:hypothetical protein